LPEESRGVEGATLSTAPIWTKSDKWTNAAGIPCCRGRAPRIRPFVRFSPRGDLDESTPLPAWGSVSSGEFVHSSSGWGGFRVAPVRPVETMPRVFLLGNKVFRPRVVLALEAPIETGSKDPNSCRERVNRLGQFGADGKRRERGKDPRSPHHFPRFSAGEDSESQRPPPLARRCRRGRSDRLTQRAAAEPPFAAWGPRLAPGAAADPTAGPTTRAGPSGQPFPPKPRSSPAKGSVQLDKTTAWQYISLMERSAKVR
jgi:hypothetical protein